MQTFNLTVISNTYGWPLEQLNVVIDEIAPFFKDNPLAKVWLAGGALRRTITSSNILGESDFDFFFGSDKDKNDFLNYLLKLNYEQHKENDNNVCLKKQVDYQGGKKTVEVQLIHIGFYDTVENLLSAFDYTLYQFALDIPTNTLYCGDTSLYDVARKRIVVNKITQSVASLRRLIKYTQQGYYACQGALTEFLGQVQDSRVSVRTETIRYFD